MSSLITKTEEHESIERRWSAAKLAQASTGRFDQLNDKVAIADAASPSEFNPAATVPVIDISPFTLDASSFAASGNDNKDLKDLQAACVDQVLSACLNTGFFKIIGHNVPDQVIDSMVLESRAFFAQSEEIKQQATDPDDGAHGYFAEENISATLGRDGAADIREGYAIGPSDCDFFQNLWPRQETCGTGFQKASEAYYAHMERLETALSIIFTRALKISAGKDDLPDDWLQTCVGRHRGLLRPNYFPTGGTFGAHTDWSTFTILRTAGPGLEVVQEGEWRQVTFDPTEESSFVINCADILARWSNGAFKSSIHRVKCPPSQTNDRISFAYFVAEIVDPTDDSVTLPIIKEGDQRAFDEDLSILDYMTRNFEGMMGKSYGQKTG